MKHRRFFSLCLMVGCVALATRALAAQSPPANVEAAPGNQSAAVHFLVPAGDNGSSITGCTVTAYTVNVNGATSVYAAANDTNAGSTTQDHVVTGLANGQAYEFTVKATNSLGGTSVESSRSNSVTPSATPTSAYAGTWNFSAMTTGAESPLGQKCTDTFQADGTFAMSCSDSYGSNYPSFACSAWPFPSGIRSTCSPSDNLQHFLCYANETASVMACTATINGGSGTSYLNVGVKEGSGYSNADLPGPWNGQGLKIVTNNSGDSWEQDSITVTGTNMVAGVTLSDPTKSGQISGALSLASNGLMSFNCTSGCGQSGGVGDWFLDSGMTVAPGFTSYSSSAIQLHILTRNSGAYSLGDLAGNWGVAQLRTDGTWRRMVFQISSDGSYANTQNNSDGTTSAGSGILAIDSSTGAVTCARNQPSGSTCTNNVNLVMDASKTVMTGAGATGSGSNYKIVVANKLRSLWQNNYNLGSGWFWLNWFGEFAPIPNTGWIYHETLGWLYVYGSSTDSLWFYDPAMGKNGDFWWTSASVYPYLYRASNSHWLWYSVPAQGAGQSARSFVDLTGGGDWLYY
ncbi:MAG: fibronectin type III domain-containing protein [Syntrophobacteraceae bacterium]|nr:fibronectin type III domain-containing protein [Syntrophobacteraceae bacterium]